MPLLLEVTPPVSLSLFSGCWDSSVVSALGSMWSSGSNVQGNTMLPRQGWCVEVIPKWGCSCVSEPRWVWHFWLSWGRGGWWRVKQCGLKRRWEHVLCVHAMEAGLLSRDWTLDRVRACQDWTDWPCFGRAEDSSWTLCLVTSSVPVRNCSFSAQCFPNIKSCYVAWIFS